MIKKLIFALFTYLLGSTFVWATPINVEQDKAGHINKNKNIVNSRVLIGNGAKVFVDGDQSANIFFDNIFISKTALFFKNIGRCF